VGHFAAPASEPGTPFAWPGDEHLVVTRIETLFNIPEKSDAAQN
jgi:hypothetical protein